MFKELRLTSLGITLFQFHPRGFEKFYSGCEKWSDRTSGGSKFVDEGFDIDHPSNNQGNRPEDGKWSR